MKCRFSITFEHNVNKPLTATGVASAASPSTIAARALREAKKQFKGKHWDSIVIYLEKVEDTLPVPADGEAEG